jgi:hypothetical protein
MLRTMKNSELERAVEPARARRLARRARDRPEGREVDLSCWAHGIVHMLEGDTSNARYWYRRQNARSLASIRSERDPVLAQGTRARSVAGLRRSITRNPYRRWYDKA